MRWLAQIEASSLVEVVFWSQHRQRGAEPESLEDLRRRGRDGREYRGYRRPFPVPLLLRRSVWPPTSIVV